jgi:hypothetical protein
VKTCLNIFAILLIVTFVNTSKSITYSDIAQSLVQLHQAPIDGLAKLGEISESFQTSNKFLLEVRTGITNTCERLSTESVNVLAALNKKVSTYTDQNTELDSHVAGSKGEIEKSTEGQKAEVEKIKQAKEDITKGAINLLTRENDLNETINVLHRLKNIAQDELAGKVQIKTQMTGINVVSNNGVSFIQLSNLKEELKTIMKKTDTQAKSLISTLIMMADSDDGHYSDPKIVAKIMAILDKIIASNVEKKKNLNSEWNEQVKSLTAIFENAADMIMRLKEEVISHTNMIEVFNKEKSINNNDILFINKAIKRRQDRTAFHVEYCKNMNEKTEVYVKRYAATVVKVNELKTELSQA